MQVLNRFFSDDLDAQLQEMNAFQDRIRQDDAHYRQMQRAARKQKRLKLQASKKFGK